MSEFNGNITKLESVTKKDDRTVVFNFERPSGLILASMARPDCGGSGIYHKDSVGADGKWRDPIGTGPFKMGEWKRGQYIELQRFDGYQARSEPRDGYTGAKKPMADRVRFIVIPDAAAAKAALFSDAIDVDFDIEPEDVAEYKARPDVKLDSLPTMAMTALLFQTKDPAVSDVRIRKALALALDTAELTDAVTGGTGKANNSPIPVSSPFYGKVQSQGYKQNIAEAKKLLAAAGYSGQTFKLLCNKKLKTSFDSAVLVQAAAKQIGMNIDVEVLDWATQLDRYTKGTYQMQTHPFSARLDASLSYEMVTGPKATQPRKVWDDAEAIAMLKQSMEITDKAKRQALFDSLHARQLEQVPLVVLFNEVQIAAVRKGIDGYKGWPMGTARLWGVSGK
jgi:peptide/nickel transport system substrate-binding protein